MRAVLSAWTRFDELFGTAPGRRESRATSAYSLNTDSLTVVRAPQLGPTETAIRAAGGRSDVSAHRRQIGRRGQFAYRHGAADSRVRTASKHLTIGVVVPLGRDANDSRSSSSIRSWAPRTWVPTRRSRNSQLRASEASLVASFRSAAAALTQQLAQCQATPTPDCASLLAQQAAVQTLIQTTGSTATAIETLYGSDDDAPGTTVRSARQQPDPDGDPSAHLGLIAQYQSLLPTVSITGTVAGAGGPGARIDMQQLLANVGHDSLAIVGRTSIGDMSVGATLQLFNTFRDTMVGAAGAPRRERRLPFRHRRAGESQQDVRHRDGVWPTGDRVGAASDMTFNRHVSATVLGSYTAQLGTIDVARVPNSANVLLPLTDPVPGTYSAGNVASISIIPRLRLAGYFVIDGQYSLTNVGGRPVRRRSTTDRHATPRSAPPLAPRRSGRVRLLIFDDRHQQPRTGRMPFEVSFSHLETIAGSGGPVPKTFRDQVS